MCNSIIIYLLIFLCVFSSCTDIEYSTLLKKLNHALKKIHSRIMLEIKILFLMTPGTKWCGPGNIAHGQSDFGPQAKTDKCCWHHDHCSDTIHPGVTKYNLTNKSFFTRALCSCDEKLHKCLRGAKDIASVRAGITYFNVIGTKCYKKDYPIIGCKKKEGWIKKKCVEHIFNTTGEKHYQWFDVPNY